MKLISLFSGIGGFELAAEWAGWQNVVSCEINPFGRQVLNYYWPNAYHHDDIKTLTFEKIDYELKQRFGENWNADDIILTGGFPCQPYSAAGKRLGKEDERHLWPEMLRVIREVQPKWVVGENVLGLVNWSGGLVFEEVQADLESEGYEVQPYVLPAASVNAPHKRDRVWFVAYSKSARTRKNIGRIRSVFDGCYSRKENAAPTTDTDILRNTSCGEGKEIEGVGCRNNGKQKTGSEQTERANGLFGLQPNAADTSFGRVEGYRGQSEGQYLQAAKSYEDNSEQFPRMGWEQFPTQPPIRSRDDGFSPQLVGITVSKHRNESIKAYGNAIVPQVVYQIFKAINEHQTKTT